MTTQFPIHQITSLDDIQAALEEMGMPPVPAKHTYELAAAAFNNPGKLQAFRQVKGSITSEFYMISIDGFIFSIEPTYELTQWERGDGPYKAFTFFGVNGVILTRGTVRETVKALKKFVSSHR